MYLKRAIGSELAPLSLADHGFDVFLKDLSVLYTSLAVEMTKLSPKPVTGDY